MPTTIHLDRGGVPGWEVYPTALPASPRLLMWETNANLKQQVDSYQPLVRKLARTSGLFNRFKTIQPNRQASALSIAKDLEHISLETVVEELLRIFMVIRPLPLVAQLGLAQTLEPGLRAAVYQPLPQPVSNQLGSFEQDSEAEHRLEPEIDPSILPGDVFLAAVGPSSLRAEAKGPAVVARANKFIGRETELSHLGNLFTPSARDASAVAIISGPPGVGKTRLASQYALSTQARYKFVYSINSSTLESLKAGLVALYEHLQPRFLHQDDTSDMEMLHGMLQDYDGEWLLVFSRCGTAESYHEILRFLPASVGHSILTLDTDFDDRATADRLTSTIHSRSSSSESRRTTTAVINLLPLSIQESVDMLLADSSQVDQDTRREYEAAVAVVNDFTGGYPLDLMLARSRVVVYGSISGCLDSLDRNALQCQQQGRRRPTPISSAVGIGSSSRSMINRSIGMLSPVASALFAIMCHLNTFHIRKRLFFPNQQFRWSPAFRDGRVGGTGIKKPYQAESEFDDLVSELISAGLVQLLTSERDEESVYSIHPEVGRRAREIQRLTVSTGSSAKALEAAIGIVAECIPHYDETGASANDWMFAEAMLPHFHVCNSLAKDMGGACDLSLQWLRLKVAGLLYIWRGDHDATIAATAAALDSLPTTPLQPRNAAEWELLVLEARVKSIFTVPECLDSRSMIAFTKTVLQKCREQRGERNNLTARMKCIHGWARRFLEPQESIQSLHEAYRYFSETLGPTSGVALMAVARLCAVQIQSTNPETRAEGLETLSSMSDVLDEKDIMSRAGLESAATIIETLASAFGSSDADYAKAEHLSRRALAIYRRSPKKSHSFISWRVYHVLHMLGQRQLWDQMALFLQQQPEMAMVSTRFTAHWSSTFELLDHDFRSFHCIKKVTDIIAAVDGLAGRWFGPNPCPRETLFDMRYTVSELADAGDYERALTVAVEQYLPFARNLLRSGFWVRNSDMVGLVLDLMAEVLLKTHGDFSVLSWPGISGLQIQEAGKRVSSDNGDLSSLDAEYVGLWNRTWATLEGQSYGITIDSRKAFFDDVDGGPDSYLLIATYVGSLDMVNLVLQRSPDVNSRSSCGKTAIYYAAKFQHFRILLRLIEASKTVPEFYFDGTTLLHILCAEKTTPDPMSEEEDGDADRDRLTAVAEVLRLGCDPDKPDMFGKTALHLAIRNGFLAIAEKLRSTSDLGGSEGLNSSQALVGSPTSIVSSPSAHAESTPGILNSDGGDDQTTDRDDDYRMGSSSYDRYEQENRDIFDRVDSIIKAKFWPDLSSAERVVSALHSLSYNQRAIIYQFHHYSHPNEADGLQGNNGDHSSWNGHGSFPLRKRRRGDKDGQRNPAGGGNGDGEGNDDNDEGGGGDGRDNNSGTRQNPRRQREQCRFLCPFNLFNPELHNTTSCAGPGWPDLRYLKEHLQRSHRVYRCPRCALDLETCEKLGEHLTMVKCTFDCQTCSISCDQPGTPQCKPRKEEGPPKEVAFFKWQLVEKVLTKSDDKQRGLSDVGRYEKLWSIIFPFAPVPRSPYSRHHPFNPGEVERAKRQIFHDKIRNNPEIAGFESIVMAALQEADELVGRQPPAPSFAQEVSPARELDMVDLSQRDPDLMRMVPYISEQPASHDELEDAVLRGQASARAGAGELPDGWLDAGLEGSVLFSLVSDLGNTALGSFSPRRVPGRHPFPQSGTSTP
ncbi:hypothetical protein B0I35DRAFT_423940 [Stachybotrys elegans]|uniref:Orc1-like AAA ATPase domain-containing protein n=1 Tax=Stachybotrys elegans TaxID=80388 RepID=A0A8K0WU39_9HYPO|nr:hypothetical protein B0I35DRAFT_423940 [Stachybotrys elegans]